MKVKDRLKEKQPSGDEKRFTLRMDAELFETISAIAEVHKRSVAKEMEYAISLYVEQIMDDTIEQDQPPY